MMRKFTLFILVILVANIVHGQKRIDYQRADSYIQKNIAANVSIDELDQIEDSVFVNCPVRPMGPQYIVAFKNYFLLRSNNQNFIRNEKNKNLVMMDENMLPFLLREGGEMRTAPLGHLAFLISYEFAYESGYIGGKEFVNTIKKVTRYSNNKQVRKYSRFLANSYGFSTGD